MYSSTASQATKIPLKSDAMNTSPMLLRIYKWDVRAGVERRVIWNVSLP